MTKKRGTKRKVGDINGKWGLVGGPLGCLVFLGTGEINYTALAFGVRSSSAIGS